MMGTRSLLVACLGLVLIGFVPGPVAAQEDPLTASERAWIEANGPIRYAPDPDYPPFEFVQDGDVQGINMDFLNRMSRNLDIEFEVVLYNNWTRVLQAMEAKEVHMLGSLAQTDDRERNMDFVGPYMSLGEVFYINVARADLNDMEDLSGKRIAVVESYAASTWLAENRPDMIQVPVPDMLSGLEAVSTGTVDAFFENVPVAGYNIRERSITNIRILGEPLYYSPANWAVQQDDAVLAGIVGKGLKSIPLGEQTAIFEYWSGYDLGVATAAPKNPLFSPLSLAVVGGLAVVLVAAGAWNTTLQRAVRSRTDDLRHSNERIQKANDELASRVQTRSNELRLLVDRESRVYEALEKQAQESAWALDRCTWILHNQYHGILRPDTQQSVELARSSAWTLTEMLEGTNDTARSDAPGITNTVQVAPLLEESVERLESRHGRRIHVECPRNLSVEFNPSDLRRLSGYLVAFAASTFEGEGAMRVVEGPGNEVQVHLPDAEPIENPEKLLEPMGDEAFGIALSAVSRIIHRAGGDIGIEQAPEGLLIRLMFSAPEQSPNTD